MIQHSTRMSEQGEQREVAFTERDTAVLQYLLHPMIHSPAQAKAMMDQSHVKPPCERGEDESKLAEEIRVQVKCLEIEAIKSARINDFDQAISILSQAIAIAPSYSSAYNNRAQAYRLNGQLELAKLDLDKAIEICHPDFDQPPINNQVARQAHAHRGFLFKILSDPEAADKDLQIAASLGHNLAALEANPFRALCNDTVTVMLEQCGVNM
jgi:tetratricopeptide (TPR) repeat protein